jgi:hypothetical protein
MRTQEQVNALYYAFIVSMSKVATDFINAIVGGNEATKEKLLFNEMTHIKTVFDESWAYLSNEEKERHCDITATYINN